MTMTTHPIARGRRNRRRFLRSFLAHPRQVGSLIPTSGRAVRAMLDMADIPAAPCVVELGAGTGVFTEELLRRLGPEAALLALEIDPELVATLRQRFHDARLTIVGESAERLLHHLDGRRADVIVSALPFTSLPPAVGDAVLRSVTQALTPRGVLLAIQYSTVRRRQFAAHFARVEWRFTPANVPPAFLFACREPRAC